MEVETEGQAVVFVGHELVAFVDESLLDGFASDDTVPVDEVDHGLVEVGEGVELELRVVAQAPLATGIVM